MTSSLIQSGDHYPNSLDFNKVDDTADNDNDNYDGTIVDETLPSLLDCMF
jgi:hypothetical protein